VQIALGMYQDKNIHNHWERDIINNLWLSPLCFIAYLCLLKVMKYNKLFYLCVTAFLSLTGQDIPQFVFFADAGTSTVDIRHAGDERLFAVLQAGRIRIAYPDGSLLPTDFLDIQDRVLDGGERGLLGLAFHPAYATNGYFFVNYTGPGGHTRISRFQVTSDQNIADPDSELILLTINQPYSNHNGGCIAFGPDGYLYIGMGDGGSGGDPQGHSQNPESLLGKMLRIDVDNADTGLNYAIPPDNPFVTDPGYAPEIWALGLRNPWRFSFDLLTGDLWIADVGQNAWEEVDFVPQASPGGLNFGWRCYEGNHPYNTSACQPQETYESPIFEYDHSASGGLSITGGYVFRSNPNSPLYGAYICGDYAYGNYWLIRPGVGMPWEISDFSADASLITFGEDYLGRIYAGFSNGEIHLIQSECDDLTVTTMVSDETCLGDDGNITLEVSGADASEITWDNGAIGEELSGLSSGSYVYTLVSGNCTISDTITVDVSILSAPTFVYSEGLLVCGEEWSSYQWYLNNVPVASATFPVYNIGSDEGAYYLEVTNELGCHAFSDTINIDISGMGSIGADLIHIVLQGPYHYIDWSSSGSIFYEIQVLDINGRLQKTIPLSPFPYQVALSMDSNLGSMFLLRIVGKNKSLIRKIISAR